MKTSDLGIALLKAFEGHSLMAYRCPAGVWTIGYGHTEGVKEGHEITKVEAERLLRRDLQPIEAVLNTLGIAFTQNQFDALVSFIFNVGTGAFLRSTMLKKIRVNPVDVSIRSEFMRWTKAGGVTLPGLVFRRRKEADLYFQI